nr:MAG TPA: hypothetical protein [Caudoviricetes sp.]
MKILLSNSRKQIHTLIVSHFHSYKTYFQQVKEHAFKNLCFFSSFYKLEAV